MTEFLVAMVLDIVTECGVLAGRLSLPEKECVGGVP